VILAPFFEDEDEDEDYDDYACEWGQENLS
jgi:hypothetical protein